MKTLTVIVAPLTLGCVRVNSTLAHEAGDTRSSPVSSVM